MMYPQQWMMYSVEERRMLAEKLNLPRSSGTHVVNNMVVSDGYTVKDLVHVTVEKLQELTGSSKTDMLELVQDLLYPPHLLEKNDTVLFEETPQEPKKIGRPKKV